MQTVQLKSSHYPCYKSTGRSSTASRPTVALKQHKLDSWLHTISGLEAISKTTCTYCASIISAILSHVLMRYIKVYWQLVCSFSTLVTIYCICYHFRFSISTHTLNSHTMSKIVLLYVPKLYGYCSLQTVSWVSVFATHFSSHTTTAVYIHFTQTCDFNLSANPTYRWVYLQKWIYIVNLQ